jgi:hypothetical protein
MPTPQPGDPADWARALSAGPHYEPPYPGAVQDEVAWHLVKHIRADAMLRSEVEVEVPASADWPEHGAGPAFYTLDLVVTVEHDGRPHRVAIESAGSTGSRALRDHDRRLRRDARLLKAGAVETIYRLRGSDLLGHMDDVLYLMSRWDAALFSGRGVKNLETLASPEAREVKVRPEQPSVLVPYELPDDEQGSPERRLWHVANGRAPHILVRRLSHEYPSVWAPYAESPIRKPEL